MGLFDRLRSDDAPRVAFIGIDGVPYSLIADNEAEFEHLSAIAREGEAGAIDSIVPPESSACWPSLTTGQNPGKTGVYGFQDREIGSYDTYVPMGRDVQATRLWDRVQEADRNATVMNVPVTFPPQRNVQRMVSGFLSPEVDKAAHPQEFADHLRSIGYRIDVDAQLGHNEDKTEFIQDAHETLDKRFEAFEHYIEQDDWDLFFGVFMTTDRVNHFLFEHYEAEGEFHDEFLEFYRQVDQYIGEIRSQLDEDTTLIVASDHGFTTLEYEVNMNQWLRENGWLSYADPDEYVAQLNNCLRDAGLLSYDAAPEDTDETAAASTGGVRNDGKQVPPEDVDLVDLEIDREALEAAETGADRFGTTPIVESSRAYASDPGTVLIFDGEDVESTVDEATAALEALSKNDVPLVESVDRTDVDQNGVAVRLDCTPATGVRFETEHSRTNDAAEYGHSELDDISDETRAYSLIPGRLYLNLDDREPRGSVPEEEYETVRDELRDELESLTGPDGEPVCKQIVNAEEAFRGEHDDIAPDLVVIPNDGFDLKAGFSGDKDIFSRGPRNGMHTFDNASLFIDDDDANISDTDLLDVAPTILSLLEIEYDRTEFDGASLV
jgi:predicted AlkP superfamily phosphohydrolase/phosphomutase